MAKPVIVLKFGGSVLTSEAALAPAVGEIYRYVRNGMAVVAVVSAFKGETDRLFGKAALHGGSSLEGRVTPYLIALGEYRSAALLGLACERAGLAAVVRQPHELSLRARGEADDSTPVHVDSYKLKRDLERFDVVVTPGFVALDDEDQTVLLGRGGTDLTAVFLAAHVPGARVRLLKDVDAVYDRDPHQANGGSRPYARIGWALAEAVAHPLVQDKAIRLAAEHHLPIEVAAVGRAYESVVGAETAFRQAAPPLGFLRVAMLGAGIVGGGVLEHLLSQPDLFSVEGVLVRDLAAREGEPGESLFTDDPERLAALDVDVFLDMAGGLEPSTQLIEGFLARGVSVVSANKQALASGLERFVALAEASGASLLYSSAVGGGAPLLETAARFKGRVASLEAVVNGTTNFVLGRCAMGFRLEDAIAEAQRAGFAEADPSADIHGWDAAAKVKLLSWAAFGALPELVGEPDRLEPAALETLKTGGVLKQIARCRREADGRITAEIRLDILAADDFLAGARNEENRLVLKLEDGAEVRVGGKGAGRWPTAEAVMGDLYDLLRRSKAAAPASAVSAKKGPTLTRIA